ncbi:hypothetical protein A9Q81_14905, partial [Gammaproteobacteria bacterium 42_54_T18]
MYNFSGKVVVITGGAGGIGQAISAMLIKQGAYIAALDLNVDALSESETLLPLATDITNAQQLATSVDKIIERFGTIDVLFNNAGITHMSRFVDTQTELFDKIMAVNFTAAVNMTRLCLPHIV